MPVKRYHGVLMPRAETRRRSSREREPESLKDKVMGFAQTFIRTEAADYAELLSGIIGPWMKAFGAKASVRVKAITARGAPCSHLDTMTRQGPCTNTANIDCAGCYKLVCLGHAFLSWKGDAICIECVERARLTAREAGHRRPEPPPGPAPGQPPPGSWGQDPWGAPDNGPPPGRKKTPSVDPREYDALRTLGLEPGVTWAEINAEFRAFTKANHPDSVPPERKAAAEVRFKKVSEAYAILKQIHGQAA